MSKNRKQHWILLLACVLMMSPLSACKNSQVGNSASEAKGIPEKIEAVNLAITGYNYTDRYINDFSVNGNSGGNIYVSNPTGGGGGSSCCATYVNGDKAWKVKVEWQIGGCTFDNSVNDDGSLVYSIYPYYKEVEVQIDPQVSNNPKYLEVHFYPDGHIEAAVTENRSAPRMVLEKSREDRTSRLVKCPDGRRPQN
ncbi:MAG: DUF3304 domain-containing protein [Pseudomonadota bacterium]